MSTLDIDKWARTARPGETAIYAVSRNGIPLSDRLLRSARAAAGSGRVVLFQKRAEFQFGRVETWYLAVRVTARVHRLIAACQ